MVYFVFLRFVNIIRGKRSFAFRCNRLVSNENLAKIYEFYGRRLDSKFNAPFEYILWRVYLTIVERIFERNR